MADFLSMLGGNNASGNMFGMSPQDQANFAAMKAQANKQAVFPALLALGLGFLGHKRAINGLREGLAGAGRAYEGAYDNSLNQNIAIGSMAQKQREQGVKDAMEAAKTDAAVSNAQSNKIRADAAVTTAQSNDAFKQATLVSHQNYQNTLVALQTRRTNDADAALSLNQARTAAEIARDRAATQKTRQDIADATPYRMMAITAGINPDPFAKLRSGPYAAYLPSPEDASQMPVKAVNEMRKTLATSGGKFAKVQNPKEIAATIKSLTPKDYQVSRIEPDDTVVFENSGVTGSTIFGPVKMKVPGAFQALGPSNNNSSSAPVAPDSTSAADVPQIPAGSRPVYDGNGKLIGYTHD